MNKLKMEDSKQSNARNNNVQFDWNDDSSFYYKVEKKESENNNLIPIVIEERVNGKFIRDEFLWNASNDRNDLVAFVQTLCNDLKQPRNVDLRDRIVKSALKQIDSHCGVQREYARACEVVGRKLDKRSDNYFQHLLNKKNISINDNMTENMMNSLEDRMHGHIRIQLKITHGKIKLIDDFLWNMNDEGNEGKDASIEQFAHVLCAEQALPSVFAPAIALSMRQQIREHKKRMIRMMNQSNWNKMNEINDPLLHESLRYVGKKKENGVKNLKNWEPRILVYKPPNNLKTSFSDYA